MVSDGRRSLEDALSRSSTYPRNCISHTIAKYTLASLEDQLNKRSSKLFCSESGTRAKAGVEILDFHREDNGRMSSLLVKDSRITLTSVPGFKLRPFPHGSGTHEPPLFASRPTEAGPMPKNDVSHQSVLQPLVIRLSAGSSMHLTLASHLTFPVSVW